MRGLTIVFRKEVRENIRDRRALFNSLLLGPILFPLLFVGLMWFLESAEQERAEQTLELPVVGAAYAPSLIRFLEQQGVVIQPEPEDPDTASMLAMCCTKLSCLLEVVAQKSSRS